ncbi:MAG: heavy metal sensor histidine kinase [Candidatus Omnitrophica bacterium]|nr:heavy metal sensor histidine kinase [Candidatus Omnitrophota bacterium]
MINKQNFFTRFFGGIRIQLALWNALFFLLIITILAGYFYFGLRRTLYKGAAFFLGHETQEVASMLKRQPFGLELVQWIDKELSERPEYSSSYQILDSKRKVISYAGGGGFEDVLKRLDALQVKKNSEMFFDVKDPKGKRYYVAAYVSADDRGQTVNYIFIGSYLDVIHEKLQIYLDKLFWMLPNLFLMAVIFGWVLAWFALRPVRRITKKMEAITVNKLDERLTLKGSGDDFDRLASTFNTMLARIQNSYERISQFTSDASHELKTPIAVMKNQIEVTLGKKRELAEYQDVLVSQLEELERLSQLIESMLFLARVDNGQVKLHAERVSLGKLLDELLDFFEPLHVSKNVQLAQKLSDEIVVRGDKTLLRQLLFNLVDNAINYNRPGGKVCIEAAPEGHQVVMKISDTGRGIAAEHLDKIFDRFYRVDPSRSSGITNYGLGLSVCKAIVSAHEGTIHVESQLEQGTVFTVSLPF